MNKLLTTDNGGHPLELDDFRWWQDGNAEAFAALAKVFGDSFIISGFIASGIGTNTTTWTAGYVVLDGEVCKVDASAAPIDTNANPYIYVELDVSYDATGLEPFENNAQIDTYEVRKATLVAYAAAQVGKVAYLTMSTAEAIVNSMITGYAHTFTKRQSFAQGEDNTAANGSAIVTLTTPTSGNIYNLNIDLATVALTRFAAAMPDGTLLGLRFTSASSGEVVISDGTATNYGFDTNGKSYLFKSKEIALFFWVDGKPRLINPIRLAEEWQTLVLAAGTTGTLKARLLDNGDVAVVGSIIVDFTVHTNPAVAFTSLPAAKYYPLFAQPIVAGNDSADDVKVITVSTAGALTFAQIGSGTVAYSINARISTL